MANCTNSAVCHFERGDVKGSIAMLIAYLRIDRKILLSLYKETKNGVLPPTGRNGEKEHGKSDN